jgi:hypothetical protein
MSRSKALDPSSTWKELLQNWKIPEKALKKSGQKSLNNSKNPDMLRQGFYGLNQINKTAVQAGQIPSRMA